jgi:hypothetical protein
MPIDRLFDIIILDPADQLAHTRCVICLKKIDRSLEKLGSVYLPNRYEPLSYTPHDEHQRSEVEHLLETVQSAERHAAKINDVTLKRELLEEVMMKRLIFYDLLDIVRAKEKDKEAEKKKLMEKAAKD